MKKILILTGLILAMATQAFAQNDTTATDTQTVQEKDTTTTTSTTDSQDESRISKGGLFIEPMIFASQEDTTIRTSQLPIITDDTSGTQRSAGIGLRFGGHVSEIFMLGVDGRYARARMEDSSYQTADSNVYNIAPTIGLQTPLAGIKLMGSYVVAGENDPGSGAQGIDLKFKEATGWRVGAGVHVLAVAVNLEYQNLTYNKTEVQSLGSLTALNGDYNFDAETAGYTLSVSFPVEL